MDKLSNYIKLKNETRQQAQAIQVNQLSYSYLELVNIQAKLYKNAKRYGLIKELKNEGIL